MTQEILIAVVPATITGLLSWAVSRWQSRRDIQKVQEQIEAQYHAERRTRSAHVLDTLLFQADLLRTQLEAVRGMLMDERHKAQQMRGWFAEIKEECARGTAKDGAAFSAKCHYHLIFSMTTLYYTAIYFLYAHEMRRLIPFTRLSLGQQADLDSKLTRVRHAFARAEADRLGEERGLWVPVQDNMGSSVRKDGSHKSYTEFCRLFVDTTFEREDHVFLRPLDFYGANPAVCLDVAGATVIVDALRGFEELRKQL